MGNRSSNVAQPSESISSNGSTREGESTSCSAKESDSSSGSLYEQIPDADHETTSEQAQEPAKEPVKEPIQEPLKEPAKEPVNEPVQEPVKEPVQEAPVKNEEKKKMTLLAGVQLEKLDKSKTDASAALDGKIVGFYFSAHWCPPCRQFTPILKDFYAEVEDDLEIVFVSLDRSEGDLKTYMTESHGDWYHIPFGSDAIKELSTKYGVSGIPALIIVKPDGTEVTKDGRSDVQNGKSPKATIAKWKA